MSWASFSFFTRSSRRRQQTEVASGAGPSLKEQHRFLDAAKANKWEEVFDMLRACPALVYAAPNGRWPVLCQAARANHAATVRRLIRFGADREQRNRDNQLPWQLAQQDSDAQRLLQSGLMGGTDMDSCSAALDLVPVTFTSDFVRASTYSPLIGDRHQRVPFERGMGQSIVQGLSEQFSQLKREHDIFCDGGRYDDANRLKKFCRDFDDVAPATKLKMQSDSEVDLRSAVVRAYTEESWLYAVLNKTLREQDETKEGLVQYARVLHDTVADAKPPFVKVKAKCWRWANFTDEVLVQYEYHPAFDRGNLLSLPGFTSASELREAAVRNMHEFKPNSRGLHQVLMIIHPDSTGQGPTRIRVVSFFPQEGEVLFPLGQVFRLMCPYKWWKPDRLARELGTNDTLQFEPGRFVIQLEALEESEAFYLLADDFFVGGGKASDAVPVAQARLQTQRQLHGERSTWAAHGLRTLGAAHEKAGNKQEALGCYQQALEIHKELEGEKSQHVARMYACIGNVHRSQGPLHDLEKAYRCYKKDYEISRQACGGEDHPQVARALFNQAIVKHKQGKEISEARSLGEKALRIWRKAHVEEDHPDVARALHFLGVVQRTLDKNGEAMKLYEEALQMREKTLGKDHPDVAQTLNCMGVIHRLEEDFDKALECYNRAFRIREKALGKDHFSLGEILNNKALVYEAMGLRDDAAQQFDLLRKCYEQAYGPSDEKTLDVARRAKALRSR